MGFIDTDRGSVSVSARAAGVKVKRDDAVQAISGQNMNHDCVVKQ